MKGKRLVKGLVIVSLLNLEHMAMSLRLHVLLSLKKKFKNINKRNHLFSTMRND